MLIQRLFLSLFFPKWILCEQEFMGLHGSKEGINLRTICSGPWSVLCILTGLVTRDWKGPRWMSQEEIPGHTKILIYANKDKQAKDLLKGRKYYGILSRWRESGQVQEKRQLHRRTKKFRQVFPGLSQGRSLLLMTTPSCQEAGQISSPLFFVSPHSFSSFSFSPLSSHGGCVKVT